MKFIIRRAKKSDKKSIVLLLKKLYTKEKIRDLWARIDSKKWFVIKYQKQIVGLSSVRVFWLFAWLRHLIIKREFRGKGLGKKLLMRSIAFAKRQSCKLLFLTTFINWRLRKPAHRFYLKNKFKNIFVFYFRRI